VKADYEQNFKKGNWDMVESIVRNDRQYFSKDFMRRFGSLEDNYNNFDYRENINAAYVNYNRQFKGIMVQAGLRAEKHIRRDIQLASVTIITQAKM
jgi:hypothetical protein